MNRSTPSSNSVRIVEVGPRDGLQNIKTPTPTSTKLELISRLRETGLKAIELTSIVSPRVIPQLSDCRNVLSDDEMQSLFLTNQPDLRLPVLVPNMKGLNIAMEHGVREVAVFVSASDGFSKANINCTVEESLVRAQQVAKTARQGGLSVRGYVSCIFEDPFDGVTPQVKVVKVVKALIEMGCYEVSLGDTLGVGTPATVWKLLRCLREEGVPMGRLAGHFHDTYGQAVANAWEAYRCGVRVFDSSVAGLGGCPYCPGARGNASTEDIVFMFQQAGVHTGVDLPKLAAVGVWICKELNLSNASRAGAALAVKHNMMQQPDIDNVMEEGVCKKESAIDSRTHLPMIKAATQLLQLLWNARHMLFTG